MSNEADNDEAGQTVAEFKGLGLSRPVLHRTDADRQQGARVGVTVTLRIDRRSFTATSEGVGHETIEIRAAAEATMDALHQAIGEEYFHLVGIKQLHAFDADVVLVALRSRDDASRRFIGAVPVRSTLVEAAAAAVLDATNRIVTGAND